VAVLLVADGAIDFIKFLEPWPGLAAGILLAASVLRIFGLSWWSALLADAGLSRHPAVGRGAVARTSAPESG